MFEMAGVAKPETETVTFDSIQFAVKHFCDDCWRRGNGVLSGEEIVSCRCVFM
jgi:hypothetical protein